MISLELSLWLYNWLFFLWWLSPKYFVLNALTKLYTFRWYDCASMRTRKMTFCENLALRSRTGQSVKTHAWHKFLVARNFLFTLNLCKYGLEDALDITAGLKHLVYSDVTPRTTFSTPLHKAKYFLSTFGQNVSATPRMRVWVITLSSQTGFPSRKFLQLFVFNIFFLNSSPTKSTPLLVTNKMQLLRTPNWQITRK